MIEITVTDKAQHELHRVLEEMSTKTIRLLQQGFGWIGPRLGMVLDEPRQEDEKAYAMGFEFVYRRDDRELLDQTLIDFRDSWYGEGFVVCSPASEPC